MTQECLRIIRNTKIELGENIRNKYLSQFMIKLKNSGYNKKFRTEVVDSAIKAFQKMVIEDKKGVKPLYRDKFWNSDERRDAKQNKKLNWYKNKKDGSSKLQIVLFVPPTPGGGLVKDLQRREEELNKCNDERIKFVEAGGDKIEEMLTQKILSKKNPVVKRNALYAKMDEK